MAIGSMRASVSDSYVVANKQENDLHSPEKTHVHDVPHSDKLQTVTASETSVETSDGRPQEMRESMHLMSKAVKEKYALPDKAGLTQKAGEAVSPALPSDAKKPTRIDVLPTSQDFSVPSAALGYFLNLPKTYPEETRLALHALQKSMLALPEKIRITHDMQLRKTPSKSDAALGAVGTRFLYTNARARAEGFFDAHLQAQKIKANAHQLAKKIQAKNQIQDGGKLHDALCAIDMAFGAMSNRYKGQAIEADLDAHARYEKTYAFNGLDSNTISGGGVSRSKSASAQIGVALLAVPGASVSADLQMSVGKSESTTLDHDRDFNYVKTTTVTAGLEANATATGVASAKAGVTGGMAVGGDFYEVPGDAQGRDRIAKYAALQKNNQRYIPEFLRSHLLVRKVYRYVRVVENKINYFTGFTKKNPNLPVYATTRALENAMGTSAVLDQAYEQLAKVVPLKHQMGAAQSQAERFHVENSQALSVVSVASVPGTATKSKAPWEIFTGVASVGVTVGPENPFSGAIPAGEEGSAVAQGSKFLKRSGLSAKFNAAAAITSTKLNATLLRPTHTLLSTEQTKSVKTSTNLAKEMMQSVWLKKSNNAPQQLPVFLRDTHALMAGGSLQIDSPSLVKSIDTPLTESEMLRHVVAAKHVLEKLDTDFSIFEKDAARFIDATRHSSKDEFFKKAYAQSLKSITERQLIDDRRVSDKPYRHRDAKDAVGRVWANYSAALGMIELCGLGRINKDDVSSHVALRHEVEHFVAAYSRLSEKIAHPDISFVQDNLYRYGLLDVPATATKVTKSLDAAVSAGLTTPATTLFGAGAGVHGAWTKVTAHPNLFRQGKFKSVNYNVTGVVFGLLDRTGAVTEQWRNGELQFLSTSETNVSSINFSTPSELFSWLGAKLSFGITRTETNTKVRNRMGPDLAYHVIQFASLTNNGMTESTIQNIKHAAGPAVNTEILREQSLPFFNKVDENRRLLFSYFGLNSIGGILGKFGDMDRTQALEKNEQGRFIFSGMNVFHDEVVREYFDSKRASANSAAHILSGQSVGRDADIFSEIGVRQERVKALLNQKISASFVSREIDATKTVAEFLAYQPTNILSLDKEIARAKERIRFFKEDPVGIELFADYVLLVHTARTMRYALGDWHYSVNPFSQKKSSSSRLR